MSMLNKVRIFLPLIIIMVAGLLYACESAPSEITTPPPQVEPSKTPEVTNPPPEQPQTTQDRVYVVYFHRPQRCITCICFEERISYVVETYFQDELDNGKMTFKVLNSGDEENAVIVSKYGAVGSQLFINEVKAGQDNIKDIQGIWSWRCTKDEQGFDTAVKTVIEQSLNGGE